MRNIFTNLNLSTKSADDLWKTYSELEALRNYALTQQVNISKSWFITP